LEAGTNLADLRLHAVPTWWRLIAEALTPHRHSCVGPVQQVPRTSVVPHLSIPDRREAGVGEGQCLLLGMLSVHTADRAVERVWSRILSMSAVAAREHAMTIRAASRIRRASFLPRPVVADEEHGHEERDPDQAHDDPDDPSRSFAGFRCRVAAPCVPPSEPNQPVRGSGGRPISRRS